MNIFINKLLRFTRQNYKFCPVCNSAISKFLPLPEEYRNKTIINGNEYFPHKEAEMLNADEYSCPKCGASDRERLYALYVKDYLLDFFPPKKTKLIHFSPEISFRNFLTSLEFQEYRTADLSRDDVDDNVDLTNLDIYHSNYFDFFICSHILEHIPDDLKAIRELHRILAPGGKGILVVPILKGLENIHENPSITSAKERLLNFGQEDHVRMYNQPGFMERVKRSGFSITQLGVNNFSNEQFDHNGIQKNSILYIVNK